jgi:hypothetical protein
VAEGFFAAVLAQAQGAGLLSAEHFTVDGTLVQAWADGPPPPAVPKHRRKYLPLDDPRRTPPSEGSRNPTVNFHGERRSNATHTSTTDPDARLARKGPGREAQLAYQATLLTENRHGLAVGVYVTPATGTAERDNAVVLLAGAPYRRAHITAGADKGFDTRDGVAEFRAVQSTPHVAQNLARPGGSAIDRRTTRHPGYAVSQGKRKQIEEVFGWLKTIGLCRQPRVRGVARVGWIVTFATAVYNLVRMRTLLAAPA